MKTSAVPRVAEQLEIGLRKVETGKVRIVTRVAQDEQEVVLPLLREEVEIETISVNRVVEHAAPIRHEGDVTIVPVYEEVLVVTKQLILKEELHIRRRGSVQMSEVQNFTLRREEVVITRSPAGGCE